MELNDLISKFSDDTEKQTQAIFSTLFIATNRLQTIFDNHVPEISLKQFMLLSVIRHSAEPLTFTQTGALLGCSRQNVKKVAEALARKGFVTIEQSPLDTRAMCILPTERAEDFFQNAFDTYRRELRYLFDVYTDDEIHILFDLLMKLYAGIDNLEEKASDQKKQEA